MSTNLSISQAEIGLRTCETSECEKDGHQKKDISPSAQRLCSLAGFFETSRKSYGSRELMDQCERIEIEPLFHVYNYVGTKDQENQTCCSGENH